MVHIESSVTISSFLKHLLWRNNAPHIQKSNPPIKIREKRLFLSTSIIMNYLILNKQWKYEQLHHFHFKLMLYLWFLQICIFQVLSFELLKANILNTLTNKKWKFYTEIKDIRKNLDFLFFFPQKNKMIYSFKTP